MTQKQKNGNQKDNDEDDFKIEKTDFDFCDVQECFLQVQESPPDVGERLSDVQKHLSDLGEISGNERNTGFCDIMREDFSTNAHKTKKTCYEMSIR